MQRCYACTDAFSTAFIRCYFVHPETGEGVLLHPICFMNFAIWLETQANLGRILMAWAAVAANRRRQRALSVLELVTQWQHGEIGSSPRIRLISILRAFLHLWEKQRRTYYRDMPDLVSSSSDSDMADLVSSSSSSDSWQQ